MTTAHIVVLWDRNTLRAIFDSICGKVQGLVHNQLESIKKGGLTPKVHEERSLTSENPNPNSKYIGNSTRGRIWGEQVPIQLPQDCQRQQQRHSTSGTWRVNFPTPKLQISIIYTHLYGNENIEFQRCAVVQHYGDLSRKMLPHFLLGLHV